MNWGKAKTILIWFFVLINSFLLYSIIFSNSREYYIDGDIIAYTADILNNSGIKIDESTIPKKRVRARQFEADNIIGNYAEFAKQLLGQSVTQESENIYRSDKGRVEFSGDRFTFVSNAPLLGGDAQRKDALAALSELGIKISDYSYTKTENRHVFKNRVGNLEIFNSEIVVQNEGSGTRVSGVWFSQKGDAADNIDVKEVTSVLVDFISKQDRPTGGLEIKSLTWGYMVYDSESYHKSMVPIPAWKIELADGIVYMDSRAN